MNRLDGVIGPGSWDMEFREAARGIVCRLTIEVPGDDGLPGRVTRDAVVRFISQGSQHTELPLAGQPEHCPTPGPCISALVDWVGVGRYPIFSGMREIGV